MARQKETDGRALMAEVLRACEARAPLYRWMRLHHDWFAAQLAETRPKWQALAEGFAKLGFRDGEMKPLKPQNIRHTWWRVRRDVQTARAKRRSPSPPPAVHLVVSPLSPFPAAPERPPLPEESEALARLRADLNKRSGR